MEVTKIQRIFDNFTNNKTSHVVIATERTNTMVSIHAMMLGEMFPKKLQFDRSCGNAKELNKPGIHWVVIERTHKKKQDGDGYFTNLWIRFVGTPKECCNYIEKNSVMPELITDDWGAEFGGTVKVFDKDKPKPHDPHHEANTEGEEDEEFPA